MNAVLYEISVNLSLEEYKKVMSYCENYDTHSSGKLMELAPLAAGLALIVCFLSGVWMYGILLLVLGIVLVLIHRYNNEITLEKQYKETYVPAEYRLFQEKMINVSVPELEYYYYDFYDIVYHDDIMFFFTDKKNAIVIPGRCMQAENNAENQCLEFLHNKMKNLPPKEARKENATPRVIGK